MQRVIGLLRIFVRNFQIFPGRWGWALILKSILVILRVVISPVRNLVQYPVVVREQFFALLLNYLFTLFFLLVF